MRRSTRRWLPMITLALLARGAVGCTQTYDGSATFNEQHPEYQNQPTYMHPNDPDDLPTPAPKPW